MKRIAWLVIVWVGCSPEVDTPTYTVEPRPFQQRVTAEGTLEAAEVKALTVPPEVEMTVRLAWLAPDGQEMAAGELVARFDPEPMQERLAEGRSDLEVAEHRVDKTRIENEGKVAEFVTDLEVAELELEKARRFQKTDSSVFSRNDIIESEIDEELAGERMAHAAEASDTQKSLSRTELDLLAIEERRARIKIEQAESGLEALEVRAPHAGILSLYRDWRGETPQIGSEMWAGQPIGEIPDLSVMEAEVFVLEADAGGLEIDKKASVMIEAHPEQRYSGNIRRIDAVAKPRFRGSPVQFFGVTVELDKTVPAMMKPGQRIQARLELTDLDNALVVPRQAVFKVDGESRVYRKTPAGFEACRVVVLASSMGLMVVSEGLSEGDVIALRAPGNLLPDESKVAAIEQGPSGG